MNRQTSEILYAEDAVHTVLARLQAAINRGVTVGGGYVFVALRRQCSSVLMRRARVDVLGTETHAAACHGAIALAQAAEEAGEGIQQLEHLLAALPPKCAEVVKLRIDGHSYAGIGVMLGISVKTVSSHLQKARVIARSLRERERERERERDKIATRCREALDVAKKCWG